MDEGTSVSVTHEHALPAEAVRAAVETGQERLRALLPGLGDDGVREPSELPGWSRAHVLSHLEGVALALARQARYALRGEPVEPYDGGRPARAAAIEAGAVRDAAALGHAVRAALAEASAAWAAVGPADWSRPVKGRPVTPGGRTATALRRRARHFRKGLRTPCPVPGPAPLPRSTSGKRACVRFLPRSGGVTTGRC
nr:maleylpyruvate isomerase N-terminal domain-containing protein [Streptomyces decoyicus]